MTERDQGLDPDRIASASFSTSFRGFDQAEVKRFLERTAESLRKAEETKPEDTGQLDQLKAELAELQKRRDELATEAESAKQEAADALVKLEAAQAKPAKVEVVEAPWDEAKAMELLGRETTSVLASARSAAAEMVANAEAEAAEMRAESEDEARELRATAEADAARIRADAEVVHADAASERARILAEATMEASKLRDQAVDDAKETANEARELARQMVAEARAVREKILADLVRKRRTGRQQLDQVKAGRDHLADALVKLRGEIDSALGSLDLSVPAARDVMAANKPTGISPTEEADEVNRLAAELDAGRAAGIPVPGLAPSQASAGRSEGAGAADAESDDAADEPAANADSDNETSAPETQTDVADPDPSPADATVDAGSADAGDGVKAAAVVEETSVVAEAPVVEATSEAADAAVTDATDEEASPEAVTVVDPKKDAEPAAAESAAASETSGSETADDGDPVVGEPAPTASSEPEPADTDLDDSTAGADDDIDHVAAEAEVVASATEIDLDANESDGRPISIFDRIRAAREAETEAASAVLAGAGAPAAVMVTDQIAEPDVETPAAESPAVEVGEQSVLGLAESTPAADEQSTAAPGPKANQPDGVGATVFLARDVALTRFGPTLRRRLKRTLADDQSALLDALRTGLGPVSSEELPAEDDQVAPFVDAISAELAGTASAGAAAIGKNDHQSDVAELAHRVSASLVRTLRHRLVEILDQHEDREEVLEPIRAHYRQIRADSLGDLAAEALTEAFALGVWDSVDDGTPLRWIIDTRAETDADCYDNSLADDVTKPAPFPTGHKYPPGAPGDQSLVVPADRAE